MARRKKKLTTEEELMELEKEITGCEDELKQIIEQKQTEALYQAVLKSEKSIEEVINWINSDSQGEQQTEM